MIYIYFFIYQQKTRHYFGVNQSGYMHCKAQTLSFQMICFVDHGSGSKNMISIIFKDGGASRSRYTLV